MVKKIIALFLTSLFLIGCQDSEEKTESEKASKDDSIYESNSKPRYIRLDLGSVDLPGIELKLLSYCWNEDLAKCSSEIPQISENEFDGQKKVNLPSIARVIIRMDPFHYKTPLPFPNDIEIYQVSDEELIRVININNTFILPTEEGEYTFILKTIYDADIKGIAYYGYQQTVKN